jgi:hypothetical protein
MSKLTDIKSCHVCNGINLIPKYNIPIPDMFTDEDVSTDILFCNDCETMHYISEGIICYEFNIDINKKINKKKLKSEIWE